MVSFIKKGAAAKAIVSDEREKTETRQLEYEREKLARKFYITAGKQANITFVDGNLYEGILENVFYEHNITPSGGTPGKDTKTYLCIGESEADEGKECPLCADGDKPRHVVALTVIDHSEYTDKKGVVHTNQRKLFLATDKTQKKLELEASTRGGLAGAKYIATRSNEAFEPRVGGTFTFLEKFKPAEVTAMYGEDAMTPLDYERVLPIYTYEELIKLGYGSSIMSVSDEAAKVTDQVDVENEL